MRAPLNRMLRWKERCGAGAAVEPGAVRGAYRAEPEAIPVPSGFRAFKTRGGDRLTIIAPNRESAETLAAAVAGSKGVRPISQEQA